MRCKSAIFKFISSILAVVLVFTVPQVTRGLVLSSKSSLTSLKVIFYEHQFQKKFLVHLLKGALEI